ncbi:MAG: hypothetical protein R2814_01690 [Flavobacteriaceae bacterium]
MIVSNDIIKMNPPYEITPEILKSITSISEKIGEVNATFLNRPPLFEVYDFEAYNSKRVIPISYILEIKCRFLFQ